MEVGFAKSFLRDLKAIKVQSILKNVKNTIIELEKAENLSGIQNVKYIVQSNIY